MKKLKTKQQSQRRNFLKATAACSTASSLGLGLLSQNAIAATNPNIKRVVFVYVPFGAPPGSHLFYNGELGAGCEPLIEHQDNIIFFEGCRVNSNDYTTTGILGLSEGGKTLDVALGETFGANSPIPTLHLGVQTYDEIISSTDTNKVNVQNNPISAFNSTFANLNESQSEYQSTVAPLEANLLEVKSLKDKFAHNESQLQRLEQFESSLENVIENSKQNTIGACETPVQDTYNWDEDLENNFTLLSNMQCDLIASAFKCDMTKVASLQLGVTGTSHELFAPEAFHSSFYAETHMGYPNYIDYSRYINERIAYLINQLKNNYDQNNQALFDSTLIFKVTGFGNADAHDNQNAPFMMAGGSDILDGKKNISADDNYDLLDSISDALGVSNSVPKYGDKLVSGIFK